jgi:hypothetical protein
MTRKSLAGRKRKEAGEGVSGPPTALLDRGEIDTVALPSIVDEAAFFDAGPGPVVFDLRRTEVVLDPAVRGLIRAARGGTVGLLLAAGPVLNRLRRLFGSALKERKGDPGFWEIQID